MALYTGMKFAKKLFAKAQVSASKLPPKGIARPRPRIETGSFGELKTSWGGVASWYHDAVEEKGSYQRDLILPNLLRVVDVKKGESVLDLACGEGFLSRRISKMGVNVVGTDIAKELIDIAKREAPGIDFRVAASDNLSFLKSETIDKAVIVLALQNIEDVHSTLKECARVLKTKGRLYFVLNHPAFRIPKQSSWGFDPSASSRPEGEARPRGAAGQREEGGVQYRRVDRYLSELREKIQMHPGAKPWEYTLSFHRPLQFFVKALRKAGLAVSNLEEWSSAKTSEPGPRAEAENRARKEIPMFLMVEAVKL